VVAAFIDGIQGGSAALIMQFAENLTKQKLEGVPVSSRAYYIFRSVACFLANQQTSLALLE
jgi:hypothetical protein